MQDWQGKERGVWGVERGRRGEPMRCLAKSVDSSGSKSLAAVRVNG